jgi:hypothetical protein
MKLEDFQLMKLSWFWWQENKEQNLSDACRFHLNSPKISLNFCECDVFAADEWSKLIMIVHSLSNLNLEVRVRLIRDKKPAKNPESWIKTICLIWQMSASSRDKTPSREFANKFHDSHIIDQRPSVHSEPVEASRILGSWRRSRWKLATYATFQGAAWSFVEVHWESDWFLDQRRLLAFASW